MKLRIKPVLSAALLALGVASTPALSQDAGWVIGAGGGLSNFSNGCLQLVAPGAACDDGASTWRAFFGYQFNSYLGYEFGYADLGKMKQTVGGAEVATFKTTVIDAFLVATIPASQWLGFFGKVGFYSSDLDRTIVGVGTTSVSGGDMTYGFGAKLNLTKNISLRAERLRYLNVGDETLTGSADVTVDLISLAIQF
jgi:outer membrane protein with beta-barrel domain